MDHATERRQILVDAGQHGVYRVGVCDVRQFDLDPDAAASEGLYGFFSFGVRVTAAIKHDDTRAVACEPLGYCQSDASPRPPVTRYARSCRSWPRISGGGVRTILPM